MCDVMICLNRCLPLVSEMTWYTSYVLSEMIFDVKSDMVSEEKSVVLPIRVSDLVIDMISGVVLDVIAVLL